MLETVLIFNNPYDLKSLSKQRNPNGFYESLS